MTSLGKYELLELIGEGGFGRVYRGYHTALKRTVAIKVCTLREPDFRARFLREAEIAASLRHPHIVTVHDIGEYEGTPYLVQEFLAGEDLDAIIKRRDALSLATRVRYLAQIAEGLAFAHDRGVIHRDVKPNNVRVLPDGQVRILDFGIAKLLGEEQRLTRTGYSIGTIGYLAPEQLRGEPIDHRADIFSLGALGYELITYRKPFEGESFTAVAYRIVHEDPPLAELVASDCPPAVAACVMRCLRKLPAERYAGCAEVAAALTAALADDGPVAAGTTSPPVPTDPSVTARGRRRWAHAAAAVGVLAVLAGGARAALNHGERTEGVTPVLAPDVGPPAVTGSPVDPPVGATPTPAIVAIGDGAPRIDSAPRAPHDGATAPTTSPAPVVVAPRERASRATGTVRPSVVASPRAPTEVRGVTLVVTRESAEVVARQLALTRTAEGALAAAFDSAGLRVLPGGPDGAAGPAARAAVIAAGRRAGARLVMVAELSVVAQEGDALLQMQSVLCTLRLRAFDARSGAVLADVQEVAPAPGATLETASDRGVRVVAAKAATRVLHALGDHW